MTFNNEMVFADSPNMDAFGRLRVSNPLTIFDSKQIYDNQPLLWDEDLESGADITSAHSADEAATTITSTINTAGKFTRQTFRRFNYQPGKSQYIVMTGVLNDSGGGTGVQRRIGVFDDENGFFFEDDEGTIKVVLRSNVTGSVVDTKVAQSSWNLDKMDGTGPSNVTMDFTKAHIWVIDFEWLGVGRGRLGMFHGGAIVYVHQFQNDNTVNTAYMSTPNLPLRYQMITTGSSPASTLVCICASVISEGGIVGLGVVRHHSTGGAHVDCATENLIYAIVGLKLKAANLGADIELLSMSLMEIVGSKFVEWLVIWNPTVAGTFAYGDLTNSSLQVATGTATSTVTGGTQIAGGFFKSDGGASKGGGIGSELETALRLGADISDVVDTLVLCVRPVAGSSGIDIEGSLSWREMP